MTPSQAEPSGAHTTQQATERFSHIVHLRRCCGPLCQFWTKPQSWVTVSVQSIQGTETGQYFGKGPPPWPSGCPSRLFLSPLEPLRLRRCGQSCCSFPLEAGPTVDRSRELPGGGAMGLGHRIHSNGPREGSWEDTGVRSLCLGARSLRSRCRQGCAPSKGSGAGFAPGLSLSFWLSLTSPGSWTHHSGLCSVVTWPSSPSVSVFVSLLLQGHRHRALRAPMPRYDLILPNHICSHLFPNKVICPRST